MRSSRRTGVQTTVVSPADPRATGAYAQFAESPSPETLSSAIARFLDIQYSLSVTGRVGAPGSLRYSSLVELATLGSDGTFGVSFRDLLAAVHLDISAEVLVVTDDYGQSFAVPVRHALKFEGAQLTLGTCRSAHRGADGGPVWLDIPGWTTPGKPLAVESIEAMTFREFLGCS